ncbi:MAG: winged helix-turn-helix domain-containing protein, partial [Candidatus Eremiobacteraeota bacterium]|nr:winged helix-turn-helix domain-containing protein [Candidatus Eremiobacteraeota bacterium]
EQRRAGVLVTQGRALLVAGDAAGALELARGAFALADRGADVLTTATLGLDCAALVAAVLPLLPDDRTDDARASGREMANAALALIATRTYHFLERTKADALAAARTLASAVTAVPALRVEVFGTMRVFAEGAELDASVWKRRRAREIFAYLVCERGRLVPRSRMIDTFWPDSDADSASDNLRVAISTIRRAVGDVVRYEAGGYRFTPPADTVIDLERFDAALSRARIARDAGDGATARAAYEAAVATYGGDLLDGFDDATWHLRERDRLRDGALEAARAVATDASAAEDVRATAIDRLLDLAPFDVEAMRVRLARLTAARRVGEARSEYERWQKRYADAFGNAPPEFWQAPRLVAIAPRAS